MKMTLPNGVEIGGKLDKECKSLVLALNRLPGIETYESCCGHGKHPYWIWFHVTNWKARGMISISRFTCPRYYGDAWRVLLDHDDLPESQVAFLLESTALGKDAYAAAERLAKEINDHVDGRVRGYNILTNVAPKIRKLTYAKPTKPVPCPICQKGMLDTGKIKRVPAGTQGVHKCKCGVTAYVMTSQDGRSFVAAFKG